MKGLFFTCTLAILLFTSCDIKPPKACRDIYMETPRCGCQVESRVKFVGTYKGTWTLSDSNRTNTIPNVSADVELGATEDQILVRILGGWRQTFHNFDSVKLVQNPASGIFDFSDGQPIFPYLLSGSWVYSTSKNGSLVFTVPQDFTVTDMQYKTDCVLGNQIVQHISFVGTKVQ